MQMLNINFSTLLICIICSFPLSISMCLADSRFIEQFQVEPVIEESLANRVTEYYSEDINLPLTQQRIELLELDNKLDQLSTIHVNTAVFWFIKGLHHKNMTSYYTEEKNLPLASSHMKRNNEAFKKSIQLSQLPDNQLSASIFSTMKHSLPEDLKIEATKNEIVLGGNGDNDSYYWYLHWSNIDQLEKAGRKQEAKQAYKKMQLELQSSGADKSIYQELTRKIENETLKQSAQANIEKPKPVIPSKVKERVKEKVYETKYIVILSVILLSIASIVAVTAYEVLQNRKNK
ncbi:MAG: hypothetical protein OQK98_07455 [Gammaproteobacteria bacterium]|nr:hypothetical protein [Gammaproteobacteria bacterium]